MVLTTKHGWIFVLILILALDLGVPFLLATQVSGYNSWLEPVSALAIDRSPVKYWESGLLILVGWMFVCLALALRFQWREMVRAERRYIWGLLLFGLGSILAGIFPEDPPDLELESISAKIHGLASFIGFLGLIGCPLWASQIRQINLPKWVNYSFFGFGFGTFVLFLLAGTWTDGIWRFVGFWQRLNLLILYLSVLVNYIWMEPKQAVLLKKHA